MHGHLAARLDPLGSEPPGDPALEPERLVPPLTPELLARIPTSVLRLSVPGETLAEALAAPARDVLRHDRVRDRAHLRPRERVWLRQAIESGRYRRPLVDRRERSSARATQPRSKGMEQYPPPRLPRPEAVLDRRARRDRADARRGDRARGRGGGAHEVVIGMAHRGRLNVLAHVVGRPYESVLREFEGERTIEAVVVERGRRHRRRQVPPRRRGRRARPRPARSRSRSPRTRAISRRSTRSSRDARARSRPTARRATAITTRRSRCRSSIHGDALVRRAGRGGGDAQPRGARAATRPAARCT